jgi:hypothetical protein
LLALEVAPLHESLVGLLHPDLVAQLDSLAEPTPACGQEATESTPAAQLLQSLEALSSRFATEGLQIYARKTGTPIPIHEKGLWLAICRRVHAAAGLRGRPELAPSWSKEAGIVLPSTESPLHPSAIWGPVLAYAVLEGMAEFIAGKETAATALGLFDRLRLREPIARAFSGGGEITEDGWRAAARVRLAFLYQTLTPAATAKTAVHDAFAGFPRAFWDDGDARWLLKVHDAAGEWYFNKELHQQMLWWVQLPGLLQLAAPAEALPAADGKKTRQPATRLNPSIKTIVQGVQDACEEAEEAGFRIGKKKEAAAKPVKREKRALAK